MCCELEHQTVDLLPLDYSIKVLLDARWYSIPCLSWVWRPWWCKSCIHVRLEFINGCEVTFNTKYRHCPYCLLRQKKVSDQHKYTTICISVYIPKTRTLIMISAPLDSLSIKVCDILWLLILKTFNFDICVVFHQ